MRWSDQTKTMFATILDYGGKKAAEMLRKCLGGPSLSVTYKAARPLYKINTTLESKSFEYAAEFYKDIGYNGPFILAIDATTVIAALRIRGNKIYGFATADDIIAKSADDIVEILQSKSNAKAKQANLFLLSSTVSTIPTCILAISTVVKGETYKDVLAWFKKSRTLGIQYGLKIIGLGADGDSKVRKFHQQLYLKDDVTGQNRISIRNLKYHGYVERLDGINLPSLMFPDWKHIIKKWRNQLLNCKKLLLVGKYTVKLEHIMYVLNR